MKFFFNFYFLSKKEGYLIQTTIIFSIKKFGELIIENIGDIKKSLIVGENEVELIKNFY